MAGRHHAIFLTNTGILLIWNLGTNFSEILSEIQTFSFKKRHLKISSAKWRPFCIGLNVLNYLLSAHFYAPGHNISWLVTGTWAECWRHFQMHFIEWKLVYFDFNEDGHNMTIFAVPARPLILCHILRTCPPVWSFANLVLKCNFMPTAS